jgi:hypothetical protein
MFILKYLNRSALKTLWDRAKSSLNPSARGRDRARAQVPYALWKLLCDLFVSDGDGLGATDVTPVFHFVDIDSDFFREALPACWRFLGAFLGAFLGFFSHAFLGFAKRFKA